MIFASTTAPSERSWWDVFWENVSNFFLTKDSSGFNYLTRIIIAVVTIIIAYFLIKFICYLVKKALGIKKKKGLDVDKSARLFIVQIVKILLWIVVAFLVISVLKIDTTGIAGVTSAITVALGLALQDLVMGFASGLIVIHQKNILAGEYICVGNSFGKHEGTVERVQIFFTYLKTPQGQELSIPNRNMLQAVVTNYTRTGRRRIDYDVGIAFNSDVAKAKEVLLDIVKGDERLLEGEECVAYVYELGQYAVGLRLRCWVSPQNYWPLYNELSEKVLLAFNKNGIYIPCTTDRTMIEN